MCRVLILDDDAFSGETIQQILENERETLSDVFTRAEDALEKTAWAVKNNRPYEIFLIDQRLGPGKDGIEIFKELRAISPDSDGIIFTGFDETESGLNAYKAGAFRYLPKTANNQEMLFVFRALKQWRKEQREHNWQKVFSNVMEASIREKDFHDVAQAVVRHSLHLGFARAHLFWTPSGPEANPDYRLLGINGQGEGCIPNFAEHLYPLGDWLGTAALQQTRGLVCLRTEALEAARQSMQSSGYQLPAGEVFFLTLRSGDKLIGALMLDYGQSTRRLSNHENQLLELYAKQVSLALDHASLYTKERKTAREQADVNHIGQVISARATHHSLDKTLNEVRARLGEHLDTTNCMIFLRDEETGDPVIHLCYKNNQPCEAPRFFASNSPESYLLSQTEALLVSGDADGFLRRNGLTAKGEIPCSWLASPLQVNGRVIGGISLVCFQPPSPFTERDRRFLKSAADQIAGAIQNCRLAEKEREEIEKLAVLSRAGVEMLQVARESEANLWKTALTIATANFGIGFNRAMLFLVEERATLVGQAAIGTEDASKARQDWQTDLERHYCFDDFLADLKARQVKPTDLDALIQHMEIPLRAHDAFSQVIRSGKPMVLSAAQAASQLPPELVSKISIPACAVVPLPADDRVLGLVLVDNKHNERPIGEKELSRLQTILNYAGLILKTLREQEKSENLLIANQEIMSASERDELKDALARVCNAALGLTEADWAIIYPLNRRGTKMEFDVENASCAGMLSSSIDHVLKKRRPASNGTTAYLQKHNELVVCDVDSGEARIGRKRITEHQFIKTEKVKAIIGINIRDAYSEESIGVFYLNYREPRNFSERDIRQARSFASLAGFAISNARRMNDQVMRRRLEAALAAAEVIGPSLEREPMLHKVVEKLSGFFDETTVGVLLYDDTDEALKFSPGMSAFYKINNPDCRRIHDFPINGQSIACALARKALKSGEFEIVNVDNVHEYPGYLELISETRSEICASLMGSREVTGKKELLGVLVLERKNKFGFDDNDKSLVEMVAQQLSLGLERFKQQEQVAFNKNISTLTAWAADMAHEINNEAFKIQSWAYLIKEDVNNTEAVARYAANLAESARQLSMLGLKDSAARQPMRLDEAIARYVEQVLRRQDVVIEFIPGAHETYINLNQQQFQQVFRHLIRNAMRAMGNRRVKKVVITTQTLPEEEMVEIQVRDFGPGVPEKFRRMLFQTNVTSKGRGGYGLLITRLLIEEMKGTIRLLPKEPNSGAVFSIKLPSVKIKSSGD